MSRTHDVTISAFDLDRLEAELSHATMMANDRLEQIRRLEREVTSWREVAGQLHAALAAAPPSGYSHSAIRCAALESYARLKTAHHTHEL